MASAVLTAASPTRLVGYDNRTRRGLQKVGLELADQGPAFYGRYIGLIEGCLAEARQMGYRWLARDVNLALFIIGRKP